jgi:TonB family protein
MKTKLTLICCLVLLFASAIKAQTTSAAKPVTWQRYKVGGEVFSVALPILPAMHINRRWFEGDKEPRREVQLGSYADGVGYAVYLIENPGPKQSLQGFIAAQTDSRWNVNNGQDVNRDGLAGKAFVSAEQGDGMVQFFASEDRLYEFRAIGAPAEDARLTKFFSSISFAKTKDGEEAIEGPGLPFVEARPADESLNKTFIGRDTTRKARLVMKPEPSYTEEARQNAITGTVVLKCIFKYDGSVVNILTVSGLPYGLTQRAIEAARRIKFIPAVKDGTRVSMWMQLEYNFNLY